MADIGRRVTVPVFTYTKYLPAPFACVGEEYPVLRQALAHHE